MKPSPRRSVIHASRMSSSRVRLACSDSRMTNRQGVEWCGAGAVMAAATARRTAAGSTGASVKSRTVRLAASTSPEPNRNMSSAGGRISARPPGPSSSVTRSARPRTMATGMPLVLALTRSAAAAISSATAATVTSSRVPNVSGRPRWSSTGSTPAAPIAASVCPARQGRPSVSVTMTPTRAPSRSRRALRSLRAEPSGSSGSSTTVPGGVLELSTPAAASTRPCLVSTIRVSPRRATTRTVSASIACSRPDRTTRPSALLTILEVTTTMSPSARSGAGVRDQPGQVGAGLDLGEPGHAGDA